MKWGAYYAAAFSLQALLVIFIAGADLLNGIPIAWLVAGYVVFGVLAGGVVGLLRPLIVSNAAAAAVAFVALFPFAFYMMWLVNPSFSLSVRIFLSVLVAAMWAIMGGPGARRFLSDNRPKRV